MELIEELTLHGGYGLFVGRAAGDTGLLSSYV